MQNKYISLLILLFIFNVNNLFSQYDDLYLQANTAFLSNSFEKAEKLFSEIIKTKPDFKDVFVKRGMCYLFTNQLELAENDFTQALNYNPKNVDAYNGRGLAYENMSESKKALEDYSQAIKYNSKFTEAYINRGHIYSKNSEYEKSINDFSTAIQLDSKNPASYFGRAKVHYKMKFFDKSMNDFNTAIAKGLINPEVYYEKGNCYFRKKDLKNAIKDYTEALKINPKYLDALNNRAIAYEQIGNTIRAEEDRIRISDITGVKFVPKNQLKYKTYKTKNGEMSIILPENWYAFEESTKDEIKLNISMKNEKMLNPGVPNVIMSISKGMKKKYNVYTDSEILSFWKGSMAQNAEDYERYDILTQKSYRHNNKLAQSQETVLQYNRSANTLFSYEIGIADTDKFFYAYLQCPDRQVEYMKDIFEKASKSIYIKF